ncbi:MAG TPA: ATP-binding cassette domain-containing protein [Ensifer sp.]|nr:ATP-binding cassette domain-containing protein [Ensifer sp.]
MFSVKNLSYAAGGTVLLRDISVDFGAGRMTALVGHNGSGKSTLLKHLAHQTKPQNGQVLFDGQPCDALPSRVFAQQVAYLPQDVADTGLMTVEEYVACGRYPWHGALGRMTEEDRDKITQAMAMTDVAGLADRAVSTLSGGERQRVRLAMLVAQDSGFLLLDEPTSALDIAHQVEVLSLIRQLSRVGGRGIVIVLHDINMAAQFCDHIVALRGGRIIASGAPAEIMSSETLAHIYGIKLALLPRPGSALPLAFADVEAAV